MKRHYMSSPNHRGYVGNGDINADHELKGNVMHEAFEAAHDLPDDDPDYLKGIKFYGPNNWPDAPPEFASALGTYFDTQLEFGKTMLRAFALALELPETYSRPLHETDVADAGLLLPAPAARLGPVEDRHRRPPRLRALHHRLAVAAAGLQVKGVGGDWIEVTPIDGTFVINLGNLMQRWSNDVFLSRPHRVVNLTTEHRYSIVQFSASTMTPPSTPSRPASPPTPRPLSADLVREEHRGPGRPDLLQEIAAPPGVPPPFPARRRPTRRRGRLHRSPPWTSSASTAAPRSSPAAVVASVPRSSRCSPSTAPKSASATIATRRTPQR